MTDHACHRPRWFALGCVLGGAVMGGLWAAVDAGRVPPPIDPEVAQRLYDEGFELGKTVTQETIREVVVEVPGPETVRIVEVVRGGLEPSAEPPVSPPEVPPALAESAPCETATQVEPAPVCPPCQQLGYHSLRPTDLGGDCQTEIVSDGHRRFARIWLSAKAHQWPMDAPDAGPSLIERGPERLDDVEFLLDDETHAKRSRWRASLMAGVTSAPGWYLGASWQGCSRWGLWGGVSGDFEQEEESFSYFDSPNETFVSETLSLDRYRGLVGVSLTLGSKPAGCYRR